MKFKALIRQYFEKTFQNIETDNNLDSTKGFLKVVLIAMIQFLFLIVLFPLIYDTNDDFWMNAIASGAYSGSPSEYLVYTNIIIGKVLKLFYTILPEINWYTVYMMLSLFMGYVAIQFSFYRLKTNYAIRIIRHILILAVLFFSITESGFTRVAAIVAAGGFLMIITYNRKNYSLLFFAISLIVLSFLIRSTVFYMYFLLALPFIVILVIKRKYLKLFSFAIAFVMIFLAFQYNNAAKQAHNEYAHYRSFNSLRAPLLNSSNPNMHPDSVKDILDTMGWSEVDFYLASHGAFDVGHEKFAERKLKQLKNSVAEKSEQKISYSFILSKFKKVVRHFWDYFDDNYYSLLVVLIVGILFISTRPPVLASVIIYAIYLGMIAFYLYAFRDGMLKVRVLFGMTLPFLLFILYNFDVRGNIPEKTLFFENVSRKNIGMIVIITSLIALFITGYHIKESSKRISRNRDATHNFIEYLEEQNHKFYVSFVRHSPYYIYKNPPNLQNNYTLGWLTGSPWNKGKIEKFTGNREAGAYTIFNKDIIWYLQTRYRIIGYNIANFYRNEYRNVKIKREVIKVKKKDMLYKYTFHITKLDISPMSTLGVEMRFGEPDRISKLAAKGLSLRMLSGGPGELELPKDMEAFEDLEIPEETEEEVEK